LKRPRIAPLRPGLFYARLLVTLLVLAPIPCLGLQFAGKVEAATADTTDPPAATDVASSPTGALWYRIEIDGKPAGWASDRIGRAGDRVTTRSRMELHLRRGGADVTITLAARFVETADGEPVLLHQRQSLGQLPVESTFRFLPGPPAGPRGDRVEAITVQADRESRETLPAPTGTWLTPDAARRAFLAHRAAGETRFTIRSIEPLQGLEPVNLTWDLLGPGTHPGAVGRWRQQEAAEQAPTAETGTARSGAATEAAATVEVDADGRLVWSSTRFLGLELTLTRTDRKSALAATDRAATPELMVSTFVHPDRPIPAPRRLRHAVYVLSLEPAETPSDDGPSRTDRSDRSDESRDGQSSDFPPLPTTGAQRILDHGSHQPGTRRAGNPRDTETVRIEVDVVPADARPVPADADEAGGAAVRDLAPYLSPSPFLDHRDPAIRALLASLDGSGRTRPGRPARPVDADPQVPTTGSTTESMTGAGTDSGSASAAQPRSGSVESDQGSSGTTAETTAPPETMRRRAARLTALVRNRIADKNLDTGFATASEVARTLSGDCTEHAVLLAALLRADGIPSRVASGLVYLEQYSGERDVFGYHMWTQAWIGGRWIDLDAALPGEVDGFDATHIALAVSALDGPEAAADFVPLAGLIGRLQIEVKELRY